MPNNLKDVEHMTVSPSHPAGRRLGGLELPPVRREPQIPDGFAEHLDCYAAAAEGCSRASFGVADNPRTVGKSPLLAAAYGRHSAGFATRAAYDRRCYLVGLAALALGLVVLLGALAVFGPSWLRDGFRSATPKVALDDTAWCSSFRGLSCKQQDTARE